MGCVASKKTGATALEYASKCYVPTTWIELPLVAVIPYNDDSKIFEFGLPDTTSLELPTCACLLVALPHNDAEGNPIVRPYTPISDNSMAAKFQLLIKKYSGGEVSSFIHNMKLGATLKFKHIEFNIKIQYPFGKKTISMLTVGTGITPMLQALNVLLETTGDETKIVMLNGNKTESDILMKAKLDDYASKYGSRFTLVNILSRDKPAGWSGESGHIDEAKVKKYCFPPGENTSVFVCGLPALYDALCGPRGQKEVLPGTILSKLGYTDSMVEKF